MSLAAGSKLGPYEIQSPLGAGGVSEVYLKRYVPDQTICPKVRCALYVDFEPLLRLSPKATQSSRWRRQKAIGRTLTGMLILGPSCKPN
jgi:hypothetical protein